MIEWKSIWLVYGLCLWMCVDNRNRIKVDFLPLFFWGGFFMVWLQFTLVILRLAD